MEDNFIKHLTEIHIPFKIAQFAKTGEFIKLYSSAKEIHLLFGYNITNLYAACRGRIKTAYGYQWRYIDNDNNIITFEDRKLNPISKAYNYGR